MVKKQGHRKSRCREQAREGQGRVCLLTYTQSGAEKKQELVIKGSIPQGSPLRPLPQKHWNSAGIMPWWL